MAVIGVTMVRDEMDILPYTLPRMCDQLDHVIVADNLSKDGSREWLAVFAADNDISVIHDHELAYLQSMKMTRSAEQAVEMGATWIVPFDADELWEAPRGQRLGDHLQELDTTVCMATLHDHVCTARDPIDPDPLLRISYIRKHPSPLPKVAFRPLPGFCIEQGNHGVRYPGSVSHTDSGVIIHHFPYRSPEQMVRKARNGAEAYAAAGDAIPMTTGQHWRDYGRLIAEHGEEALHEVFRTWFWAHDPDTEPSLVRCSSTF